MNMSKFKNGDIVINISIIWIFVVIIFTICVIAFCKNHVFATNVEEDTKTTVVAFEQNQKAVNIVDIMVENTGENNKKMVNEQRNIQFNTQYEDNPNLPKDEKQTKQEGKIGKVQVTSLQEYKNEEMVSEEIIESTTLEEAVTEVIYVGTSEFMKKYSVHIGDQMYLLEAESLKEKAQDDSNTICEIPRYLNVALEEAGEEWIKVKYNGN